MGTAEQIRQEWWAGALRMREPILAMRDGFYTPLAKLWAEKMFEVYPELRPTQQTGSKP